MGKPALTMKSFTEALLADNVDGPWARLESPNAEFELGLRLGFMAKLAVECGLSNKQAWIRAAATGRVLLERRHGMGGDAPNIGMCKRMGAAMLAWGRDAGHDRRAFQDRTHDIINGALVHPHKDGAGISDILSTMETRAGKPDMFDSELFFKRKTAFLTPAEWEYVGSLPPRELDLGPFLEAREISLSTAAASVSRPAPRM